MPSFRKKPVVIEARRLTLGNGMELESWINDNSEPVFLGMSTVPHGAVATVALSSSLPDAVEVPIVLIPTLEGVVTASLGDWIIRGVKGEFYPCKPDIFEATYEKIEVKVS